MANENSGRRKLLKILLGAGAITTGGKMLPDRWVKPMVDSVILPVHAQASDDDDDDDSGDAGP